jgi:succinylglutamate desuccinylase
MSTQTHARVRLLKKRGIEYSVFYNALGMSQAHFSMCLNEVRRSVGSPHRHVFNEEQLQKINRVAEIMEAALKMVEKL